MDFMAIIERYYTPGSKAHHFLVHHSRLVADKALKVAVRISDLKPDLQFIEEASMLHDIGIFLTHAPEIGCFGIHPYIVHGFMGRELLEREGLPRHALVCERHVGAGLTLSEIEENNLPLPKRDMLPLTLEEKIICFADKFYSKHEERLTQEKSAAEVRAMLARYGAEQAKRFEEWLELFKEPLS